MIPINYDKQIKISPKKVLGYFVFCDAHHPLAFSAGWVYLHRHLASMKAGVWLNKDQHVHHIDGNKENNKEDNLEILSRREHSLKHVSKESQVWHMANCPTCKKEIVFRGARKRRFCSQKCVKVSNRKVERPTIEELKIQVGQLGFQKVGKLYGVSDNTIRNWFKESGIAPKTLSPFHHK